jgi:uncharacterized protein involved in exopolysaccharide biosynthesis
LFPVAAASVSGSLLTESAFSSNEILTFGGEKECEQMMQIMQSSEIRTRIIKKYNLAQHYGIDSNSKSFYFSLNSAFDSNIKFRRTEYMSVVIEVLDTDPDTAALIANDIANNIDTVMNQIVHERAVKALSLVENEYNQLISRSGVLQDSLKKIRELGVLNYEAQTQALSNAYAVAVKDGNTNAARQIERKLSIIAKYGGAYESVNSSLSACNDRLKLMSSKYQQAKVDAEQNLPYKYVVERAYPSDRKAYPTRWIIVFVSTLSTLFFALVILLIRDTLTHKQKD